MALASRAAAEPPSKQECLDSFVAGQKRQRAGDIIGARDAFIVCARDPCPATIQPDCIAAYREAARRTPSIVVRIERDLDAAGAVVVRVDGTVRPDAANGRAVELNPGAHTVVVDASGHAPLPARSVVVADGEQLRFVAFDLRRPKEPPPAIGAKPGIGPLVASTAVAAIGLGGFAVFGALGKAGYDDLARCRPGCDRADGTTVKREFLVADLSLALGVVGLGAAVVLALTSPPWRSSADGATSAGSH